MVIIQETIKLVAYSAMSVGIYSGLSAKRRVGR